MSRQRRLLRRALVMTASSHPHPNPRVGALVLDAEGRQVGRGVHQGPGNPHAEVLALTEAGERARGGVVITTLEPCVHIGRTSPCVERISAAGVDTVVVGALDPDRRVAGRSRSILASSGVETLGPVLTEEVEEADPGYFHHRRRGRPLFILKAALTLDGWVAAGDGTSQWISGRPARRDGHRLRASVDAVMVGAGTLRDDDPRLTVRLDGHTGPQPQAVIVAGKSPLPRSRKLWDRNPTVITARRRGFLPADDQVVAPGADGLVDLPAAARALGERGILSVLVEGGPRLSGALWADGLVDRGVFYLAARIAGGSGRPVMWGDFATLTDAREIVIDDVRRVGEDLRVAWRYRREGA